MNDVINGKWWGEFELAEDEAGIAIPFPHRSLYAGSETQPFPVRIVENRDGPSAVDADARSANRQ
jgi:hypothetical protein